MAGKCWVYAFLKINSRISLRLPEPTSMNRVLGKALAKGKSVKRRVLISSSEESNDIPLAQLCDDDDDDEISSDTENGNTNDICKLYGEFGRNNEIWLLVVCNVVEKKRQKIIFATIIKINISTIPSNVQWLRMMPK